MKVDIRKLDVSLVDDYFRFFDQIAFAGHPEWGCECYCSFFHAADAAEWQARTGAQNQAVAREMILAGRLQGLFAYIDGQPAAWCHYDRKDNLPGIRVFYPQLIFENEDAGIAAIVCFTVAQHCRGQGLASLLLAAACEDLAAQGYHTVEAYPRTAASSVEEQYHGPLSMYPGPGLYAAHAVAGTCDCPKRAPGINMMKFGFS
jgi:GNAT superfamily N-acetyltransferase